MRRTRIDDPDLRRLRALKMIEYRISNGASRKDIAEAFGVSENTVAREMTWAKRAKLVVEAEDRILSELVPASHEAIKEALAIAKDPEAEASERIEAAKVGLEVFKGIVPGFAKTAKSVTTADSGSELARHIEAMRSELGVLDGTIETDLPKALPPATADGDPNSTLEAPEGRRLGNGAFSPSETGMGEVRDTDRLEGVE